MKNKKMKNFPKFLRSGSLSAKLIDALVFVLSANVINADPYHEIPDDNTIERTDDVKEDVTEHLKNTGLFTFESDSIINNIKVPVHLNIFSEVTKSLINNGKLSGLNNYSYKSVKNRGYIYELGYSNESDLENTGYINTASNPEKTENKNYINELISENIDNEGVVESVEGAENMKNYGYAGMSPRVAANPDTFENYGIMNFISYNTYRYLNMLDKLTNKGIIYNDYAVAFAGDTLTDDKGRTIRNFGEDSNANDLPSNVSNKNIVNIYKMKVDKDLTVRDNSVVNMYDAEIGANRTFVFDNSTANIKMHDKDEGMEIGSGVRIEVRNNSTLGVLEFFDKNGTKLESLTIDNTSNVGNVVLNVKEINLISNPSDRDRVLNLSGVEYVGKDNELKTNVVTNVTLLNNAMLGNIAVKDGAVLTIGQDSLINNGIFDSSSKKLKNDISIEGSGKIIIGIDPHNIEDIIALGEGNNLTESVIGQKDTATLSDRLAQAALNIDADSLLHDIVILPAESVTYTDGAKMVRNKLKVLESTELPPPLPVVPVAPVNPTQPVTPVNPAIPTNPVNPETPGVPTPPVNPSNPENPDIPSTPIAPSTPTVPEDYDYLNAIYKSLYTAGWVKDFRVYDSTQLDGLYRYIRDIYSNNPYSVSSNTSFGNLGTFRSSAIGNGEKAEAGKWIIAGGINHDTDRARYNSATTDVDTDRTGLYAKSEYGLSDSLSAGIIIGGASSVSKMDTGKVKGNTAYVGAYAKKSINNLRITAGIGAESGNYRTEREAAGYAGIVDSYVHNGRHRNTGFDVYTDIRYSQPIGKNLYIEPSAGLAYSTVKQGSISEDDSHIALEIDSKRFNRTTSAMGVNIKKEIPMGILKHTFSAGVSHETVVSGAKEDTLTGRVRNGTDFEISVPKKEKSRTGIEAEYRLDSGNGLLFNTKMEYVFRKGSNKKDMKFKTGLSYEF